MSFRRIVTSSPGARSSALRAVLPALLGAGLATALPRAAVAADDGVGQCMQSYELGQRLRRDGDLLGAATELLVCGGPACPVRMQGDCQRWLDDVERATPAVVFRVRDAGGSWLAKVDVSIDGAAPRRLDGRAIAMNPGEHVLLFEREGYRPLRTPVIVAEGEKLERRVVTLQALGPGELDAEPPAALEREAFERSPRAEAGPWGQDEPRRSALGALPPAAAEPTSLWGPLALGGVALAGGLGFVYFGVRAQSGEADLEQCTPHCTRARVDDVKDDFLRSNVSLGVGLAGIVGAGLWLLLDRPASLDGGARQGGAQAASRFGLGPVPYWVARF